MFRPLGCGASYEPKLLKFSSGKYNPLTAR